MSTIQVTSQTFEELSSVGSVESNNTVQAEMVESPTVVGVRVEQRGPKKAIQMDVVLPAPRSSRGSRRTTRVTLSGRQARQVYETLRNFYEKRSDVENDTAVLWY